MDKSDKVFKDKRQDKEEPPLDSSGSGQILSTSKDDAEMDKIISFCKKLDIPPIDLRKYKVPPEVINLIHGEMVRTYNIIPIAKFGDVLTVAISDPFDIVAIDGVKAMSKSDIQLVLANPLQIVKAIEEYYGRSDLEKTIVEQKVLAEEESTVEAVGREALAIKEIEELSQSREIIEVVNGIIIDAVRKRASDIHIETYPDNLRIRYRIDGVLQERESMVKKKDEHALVARIKIMSNLDITQKRLSQDGRISLKLDGRDIDLRVSILPLVTGEKVVLRILEKGSLQLDLERLGFSAYAFESFKKASERPHGMILITGPTGSGKSTTLYAILNRLNNTEKNLMTIEDPVEYQISGITQIQVKPEIGLSFANILRASLRQNPDIVMVGEIRDFETVDIAIKAALTGHLILSTLHTNDAPSAIVRMINMGVEPFLISSTVTLIAAQRLCRKVCPKCKEPYEASITNLKGLPVGFQETKATFYRGKGCAYCNNSGYFGRVAIVEALAMDDYLRQMVLDRKALVKICEYARQQGMKTLREDALQKCLAGDISLEEVLRVTSED